MAKKKENKERRKKKREAFFDFRGNRFTKLARDYHHELLHLTGDLLSINRRIQESATLSRKQIGFLRKKNSGHLVAVRIPACFSDTLYHLENFSFRITGYRDKLVQFINQALRIGFDEKAMGVLTTIESHGTIRDAHLDTELKKFNRDKDLKAVLNERILMTHRRYYGTEAGYSSILAPSGDVKNWDEKLKDWGSNIQTKVNRADRIMLKVMDINNRVMQKINDYLKKHPIR